MFGNKLLGLNPTYDNFTMNTEWFMDAFANIWEPLLFGCVIIGILSSVAGYLLMHLLWRLYAYKRLKKMK